MEAYSYDQPQDREYTVEEYLELDAASDIRWEYSNGRVWPVGNPDNVPSLMAGAQREHLQVSRNVMRRLDEQLEDSPCEPYASDLRLQVEEAGQYYYPDIVVACEGMEIEDRSGVDTLTDARIIIEILSSSTAGADRGAKFASYRRLPSLASYVLIDPLRPYIEQYNRSDEGNWVYLTLETLDAVLELPSIACTIPLAQIYARVEFPPPDPQWPRLVR